MWERSVYFTIRAHGQEIIGLRGSFNAAAKNRPCALALCPRAGHPGRDEKQGYNSALTSQKFSNDFRNLDVILSQKGPSMGHFHRQVEGFLPLSTNHDNSWQFGVPNWSPRLNTKRSPDLPSSTILIGFTVHMMHKLISSIQWDTTRIHWSSIHLVTYLRHVSVCTQDSRGNPATITATINSQ
jgi:hypothetical protein